MRCDVVRENLGLFVDRELHSEFAHLVALHLRDCEECQRQFSHLQRIGDLLSGFDTPALPDGFASRTVARASELAGQRRFVGVGPSFATADEKDRGSLISRGAWLRDLSNIAAAAVFLVGLAIGGLMSVSIWEFAFESRMEHVVDSNAVTDLLTSVEAGDYASSAEDELMVETYLALLEPTEGQEL